MLSTVKSISTIASAFLMACIVLLTSFSAWGQSTETTVSDETTDRKWSILLFGGQLSGNAFGRTLNPTSQAKRLDIYFTGAALNRRLFSGNYFDIEAEGGAGYQYSSTVSGNDSPQVWGALYLRYKYFPWNKFVHTTIAMNTGFSYSFKETAFEAAEGRADGTRRLLHYLAPEITFSHPKHRDWELVFRLHHRSGIYGLLGCGSCGTNFVTVGVRKHFSSANDILNTQSFTTSVTNNAVDGFNASLGFMGSSLDGTANGMITASFATPLPYTTSFGFQADLAFGYYDGNTTSSSTAGAGHLFWRDPEKGMIGAYADWALLGIYHSGRIGIEASRYIGPWSIDGMVGMEFGQNVYTKLIDEVDISYHFDENFKASIGHRLTSRGHMANIGFEKQFGEFRGSALSVFGEAEVGEDNFTQAFAGIKIALGHESGSTLMQRDRQSGVRVRIPRNLSSISQCGKLDKAFDPPKWLESIGLVSKATSNLCASKSQINDLSSSGPFKP